MNNNSCFEPKTFFYYSNGTGRDTYVLDRNAGFTKEKYKSSNTNKFNQYENMRMSSNSKPYYSQFEAKTNHYFSDGSGRDHYITCNEGGQIQAYVQNMDLKNKAFALRSYQKSFNIRHDDFFMKSQKTHQTNHFAQQILSQKQFALTQTLSQPKKQYNYGDSNKLSSLKENPLKSTFKK